MPFTPTGDGSSGQSFPLCHHPPPLPNCAGIGISRLSAPAAAGSTWPSRILSALTHLAGLPGVREPRHQTPQNLNESLRSCAASAARTRARARSQCQCPWQLKREGWHALHPDGRRERRTVLPTVPPPSAIVVDLQKMNAYSFFC